MGTNDNGQAVQSGDLLACPFCGNPPKLFEWDNGDMASVECAGPCLMKDVTTGRYCGKARAIEAWNTRANAGLEPRGNRVGSEPLLGNDGG